MKGGISGLLNPYDARCGQKFRKKQYPFVPPVQRRWLPRYGDSVVPVPALEAGGPAAQLGREGPRRVAAPGQNTVFDR